MHEAVLFYNETILLRDYYVGFVDDEINVCNDTLVRQCGSDESETAPPACAPLGHWRDSGLHHRNWAIRCHAGSGRGGSCRLRPETVPRDL